MELAWKGCWVHLLILSQRNKFCNTMKVLKVIYTYITLHTPKKYTQDHVSVFQNIYMQIIKCKCNLQNIRNVNLYGHLDLHNIAPAHVPGLSLGIKTCLQFDINCFQLSNLKVRATVCVALSPFVHQENLTKHSCSFWEQSSCVILIPVG